MESAVNKVCGGVELVSDRRATRKRGTQKNRRRLLLGLDFKVQNLALLLFYNKTGWLVTGEAVCG